MNQTNQKSNTFAQMVEDKQKEFSGLISTEGAEKIVRAELSADQFSDVAIGDQIKYERPNLNNTTDTIAMFQVFSPSPEDEVSVSKSGDTKYWKVTAILTYESKNEDGVQNREYISGARAFVQKDGSASPISFWYKDAAKQSQMSYLWELVAKAKKKDPEKLSPREFVAFLNSKPKVKIIGKEYDNYNAPKGAPKTVTKNMPGEFIA
jgi:hypothetical protein